MITGSEQTDEGSITVGQTVKLAHVDQMRDVLDPEKTVWQLISGGQETIRVGTREINSRAYCSRFNFSGADQQKKIGVSFGLGKETGCNLP